MIKLAIAKEHRQYFEKHQFLELEGILSESQANLLRRDIRGAMSKYVSLNKQVEAENFFAAGRDLWRKNKSVAKVAKEKTLAAIAAELMRVKFLRLAYDQYLPAFPEETNSLAKSFSDADSGYVCFLQKKNTLQELSCIQGLVCGLIICLSSSQNLEEEQANEDAPFPKKAGNVVFFSGQKVIDFSELEKRAGQEFILIAYADKSAVYAYNENDSHLHAFKQLGYVFGDRLNDTLNPVLFRS